MAYTDIDKPSDYFNTKLYTGNGSSGHAITGVGFSPSLVWAKARNNAYSNTLYDVKRGVTKRIYTNSANGENTEANSLTAFGSDGFTLGSDGGSNVNSGTFVSWNWKAGTAISNSAGSPTGTSLASSGSVNTDAGFSVVTYASNGNNYTVPHGLGVAPNVVIVKNRSITKFWAVYHSSLGNTKSTFLDTTAAADTDATYWQNTTPTSTVFSVGTNSGNNSGNAMVAYCFAEKQGYSKFGSYTGNGNIDGTFVYTGFKPQFVMFKETGNTSNWTMYDTKRIGFNQLNYVLVANDYAAEWDANADHYIDILSNGIKFRGTSPHLNRSGGSYIYMAFAENPFVTSTGVPACAR